MTEIERKALALVNEVCRETDWPTYGAIDRDYPFTEALCRAIEQHEAFKQEVSDAVEAYAKLRGSALVFNQRLQRFILAKPVDPLVEAMHDCGVDRFESWADQLRAAIEKRGGKIVWGEG